MAATIVTHDPIFGWFAYGGVLSENGNNLSVSPRDGLRRRFDVVIPTVTSPVADDTRRLKIELDRDGFAATSLIALDKTASRIAFTVENRTATPHTTGLRLSFPINATYTLLREGRSVALSRTDDSDYPWSAAIVVNAAATRIELIRNR